MIGNASDTYNGKTDYWLTLKESQKQAIREQQYDS